MAKKVSFSEADARRIASTVRAHERGNRDQAPVFFRQVADDAGGGLPIRLGQTAGVWPNEPPLNVKAVQLFKQPDDPAGPADWVPETDEFGDPVFAVTINWFSHVPVGQGDLIKWCAVVPISDLSGEFDTGQKTYNDGVESPIMRPYEKLWLLIAVEC
jgi:hypothetical protein